MDADSIPSGPESVQFISAGPGSPLLSPESVPVAPLPALPVDPFAAEDLEEVQVIQKDPNNPEFLCSRGMSEVD